MIETESYTFKQATNSWEIEQIFELNYETFVEEIPQHASNDEKSLVDRFHEENTYFICLKDDRLIGMIAGRCSRPFSLDLKIPNLDRYLPDLTPIVELRLLAVHQSHRGGRVFRGLYESVREWSIQQGFRLAIISGHLTQYRLYRHLGFVPFGPRVGSGSAVFQPMYLIIDSPVQ